MNRIDQNKHDKAYMKMAMICDELNYIKRNKYGFMIVSQKGKILSHGYGAISSEHNNICIDSPCEHFELKTDPNVLNIKEINEQSINDIPQYINATLYITHCPCLEVAELFSKMGISRVCYSQDNENVLGIYFLKRNNIIVEKIEL